MVFYFFKVAAKMSEYFYLLGTFTLGLQKKCFNNS